MIFFEPITMHHLREPLFFFILLLFIQFSLGRDTLYTGQTLGGNELLVSSNKTFALGFFSPSGMSKNRYLGIWYYKVLEKRFVWVANRDNPNNDTSAVVSFQKSNNFVYLVIDGPDLKTPISLVNVMGQGKNYSAQLLETGNLVVYEKDKKGVIAWQSFDYPTDTWLPGMKLGMNRKTGKRWSLTSWKSVDDPRTGENSFRMDNIRELSQLSLYKGSDRIWRTGPLNGGAQLIADMSLDSTVYFTYVDNKDEVYLMYGMHNPAIYSITVVYPFRYVVRMTSLPGSPQWQMVWKAPNEFCDWYGMCGPNGICDAPNTTSPVSECKCLPGSKPKSPRDWNSGNASGGCVRKRDRNDCKNGEGFKKLSVTKMPDTGTAIVDRTRGGLQECKEVCLRDCNCTAYADVLEMGSACVMWYGDLMDITQIGIGRQHLFVRIDAVEAALDRKKKKQLQQHYSPSNK